MSAQIRKLAAASLVVMAGFVASRILGLVRNMVVVQQFGTAEYEAFVAALTVPDLVFQIVAGGAVGSAFIPVFKSYFAREESEQGWHVASAMMTLALLGTAPLALLLAVFARPLSELVVPGRDAAFKDLTAHLMTITLVSPVIFAISGFATGVLNSFQRFALTALAPIAYNLTIIASAYLLRPFGIEAVAIGVAVGAALHLLVQIPGLIAQGMRFRFAFDFADSGVREVLRLTVPRMFGLGVVYVNQLVTIVLASFLVEGSIKFLTIAWLMMMTPLVLAMAVSTAIFPTLAEEGARDDTDAMTEVFLMAFRLILFLTIPMAIGLATLGEPLIRLLFEYNAFSPDDTRLTAYALTLYAIGLAGHATVEVVDRVFYALHDTRTPVLVAFGAFLVSLGLGLVLMRTPLNYGGLALANALAALVEAGLLVRLIGTRLDRLDLRPVGVSLARTAGAGALMGLTIAALPRLLQDRFSLPTTLELALVVGLVALAGAAVYLAFAYILRSEELRLLFRLARPG